MPPYVSFLAVKRLLRQFRDVALPVEVDGSIINQLSQSARSQLIAALRYLELVDANRRPTEACRGLVSALDSAAWPDVLAAILKRCYQPLFEIDLSGSTPAAFNGIFERSYPGAPAVQRKAKTFFLHAAREAGIASPYLLHGLKPRSRATRRQRSRVATMERKAPAAVDSNSRLSPPGSASRPGKAFSELLLAELDTKRMSDAEQEALWTLLKYFRAQGR